MLGRNSLNRTLLKGTPSTMIALKEAFAIGREKLLKLEEAQSVHVETIHGYYGATMGCVQEAKASLETLANAAVKKCEALSAEIVASVESLTDTGMVTLSKG